MRWASGECRREISTVSPRDIAVRKFVAAFCGKSSSTTSIPVESIINKVGN